MLYQLSYEATEVGSRSIVGSYVPVKELTCPQRQWLYSSVGRASHRYCEVTSSNLVEVLNFFQASLRNCINSVHCDDHFFIFISFPQFIYDLFHISLTTTVFRLAKQQLDTFIRLLHDYNVKLPNFTFCGGRENKTTTFIFFSWTSIQSFKINLLPTFDELNEME